MAEEDILYGKNRHLFGGIEPSNMKKFVVSPRSGMIMIEAQLPDDTIIDGQTLCTVAGAVIRRSDTSPPTNEFEGVEVGNITSSVSFIDTAATYTGTYYYAAFPYTTQGVYNRNPANRYAYNEPENMVTFTAECEYDSEQDVANVALTVDLPVGAKGAMIRRGTSGYPYDVTSGVLVQDVTEDGIYLDEALNIGTTYYYSAFPYTETNGKRTYNKNSANRTNVLVRKHKYLYGFDIDLNDPNPSTRVIYPSNVDNAKFASAYMDFGTSKFNYGGWNLQPGKHFMPKPCMLKFDGSVESYLDPNDYTKTESGASSGVTNSKTANAMMEWPKIYTHREVVDGVYKFRCSDAKIDDDWDCWCNYDKNDNQIDHFYTAIYCASIGDNVARSISGYETKTTYTISNFITAAGKNGDDWYISVLSDYLLISDLLILLAKTTDCQTAYGRGRGGVSNGAANGSLNQFGMFYGTDNTTSNIKVFGMESWWGNYGRYVAGWLTEWSKQKVKLTRGMHDGTTVSDYNLDATGYLSANTYDDNLYEGYINETAVYNYGRLPIGNSGSSSTYECDVLMTGRNDGDTCVAVVGGFYSDTYSKNGPFRADLSIATSSNSTRTTTMLSCKPAKVTE